MFSAAVRRWTGDLDWAEDENAAFGLLRESRQEKGCRGELACDGRFRGSSLEGFFPNPPVLIYLKPPWCLPHPPVLIYDLHRKHGLPLPQ